MNQHRSKIEPCLLFLEILDPRRGFNVAFENQLSGFHITQKLKNAFSRSLSLQTDAEGATRSSMF